jgi:predicted transcriptional regulator
VHGSVKDILREIDLLIKSRSPLALKLLDKVGDIRVEHILSLKPKTRGTVCDVAGDELVFQAVRKMAAHDLGALVVTAGGRMIGVLTEVPLRSHRMAAR